MQISNGLRRPCHGERFHNAHSAGHEKNILRVSLGHRHQSFEKVVIRENYVAIISPSQISIFVGIIQNLLGGSQVYLTYIDSPSYVLRRQRCCVR